jgi:hypothetical protein
MIIQKRFDQKFTILGRPITVTGAYIGHGPDDPDGYYYQFDDEPQTEHWIAGASANVRFKVVSKEKETTNASEV